MKVLQTTTDATPTSPAPSVRDVFLPAAAVAWPLPEAPEEKLAPLTAKGKEEPCP